MSLHVDSEASTVCNGDIIKMLEPQLGQAHPVVGVSSLVPRTHVVGKGKRPSVVCVVQSTNCGV